MLSKEEEARFEALCKELSKHSFDCPCTKCDEYWELMYKDEEEYYTLTLSEKGFDEEYERERDRDLL